jgi:hypothetical protein
MCASRTRRSRAPRASLTGFLGPTYLECAYFFAALIAAEENDEPVEVVVLCAACSEREFGEVTASET